MAKSKGTRGKALARIEPEKPEDRDDGTGRMIYLPDGSLAPAIPYDPDMPPVDLRAWANDSRAKLPNGLSRRTDLMARLIARGVQATPAYRVAYKGTGKAIQDARRAWSITRHERFKHVVLEYRARQERLRGQASMPMRDFVLSRLSHEAQGAPEASARIKALDLLGKSEALWTTVHRTEKAISPKDMQSLRIQLEQRLKDAMIKLNTRLQGQGVAHSHDTGSGEAAAASPVEGETAVGGPQGGGTILISNGSHPKVSILSNPNDSPDSGSHREMQEGDL